MTMKTKKTLQHIATVAAVLLTFCLVFMMPAAADDKWDGTTVATAFAGGTGTSADPYQIATGAQLAYLAQQVNSGTSYQNQYFKLTDNIDLDNKAWTPIGKIVPENGNTPAQEYPFSGTFDGKGYIIENLKVTSNTEKVGLFGYVKGDSTGLPTAAAQVYNPNTGVFNAKGASYSAKVGNFKLVNVDVSGSDSHIGAAVGTAECAYIYQITVESGKVYSTENEDADSLGGVVGRGVGSFIDGCINKASVSGTGYNVGGIVGAMRTTDSESIIPVISGCENFGTITYTLTKGGLGGICGQSSLTVVIYDSKNHGSVSGSATSTGGTINNANSVVSGILGTSNGGNIIVNCINDGAITGSGDIPLYSLSGIYGHSNGDSWVIGCTSSGSISGNAQHSAAILAHISHTGTTITIKSSTVAPNIENMYIANSVTGYNIIYDGMVFSDSSDFNAALPNVGHVQFTDTTISEDSVSINLGKYNGILDLSGISSPKKFTLSVFHPSVASTVIFPDDSEVEIPSTVSTELSLKLQGTGITVINKGTLGALLIENSADIIIKNDGTISRSLSFWSADNAVVRNTGTIGSTDQTNNANQHVIQTSSTSENLIVHNHGNIHASPVSAGVAKGYLIHQAGDGLVFLNYNGASVTSGSGIYMFAGLDVESHSVLYAFANSITSGATSFTNLGTTAPYYDANKIVSLNITQMPTKTAYDVDDTFDPTGLVVKANFTTGTGYNEVELDNAWLVFENTTIAADKPVTVSFLGSFKTVIPVTVNTPVEPEPPVEPETPDEPEIPDVPETPDVPEVPDNQDRPSSSGTSTGDYQYYPRAVPTDGIVSFGSSKVVKGMELPAGSDGTVTLNTKPTFAMPENGFYAFEIDAPGYNLDAKINGGLSFQIPVADLEAAGWTAEDIVLFHGTVGEDGKITWEALPTNLVKNENGVAYYKAAIAGCSPFYIGFVKDGSVVNTEVVDPVTPETPDEPEVLPPVDEPETPEQPTESPAPILAVLAGLGAAVVLRRK